MGMAACMQARMKLQLRQLKIISASLLDCSAPGNQSRCAAQAEPKVPGDIPRSLLGINQWCSGAAVQRCKGP